MNEELLFSFQELLTVLIDQPSSWSNHVTDISALLRQMHHLLNMLRPHQVRLVLTQFATDSKHALTRLMGVQAWATLAQTLQLETEQRTNAAASLQKQIEQAQVCIESCMVTEVKDR